MAWYHGVGGMEEEKVSASIPTGPGGASVPVNHYHDRQSEGHPVTLPSLYVVTVSYNSLKQLEQLVISLHSIRCLRKLIIVNHSKTENLSHLRAEFPIDIINQENRGYGAGLNAGLRMIADHDAVTLLCNPDITVIRPGPVETAVEYLTQNPTIGCLIPALVDEQFRPIPSCRQFYTLKTLIGSRIPGWRKKPPLFMKNHFYMDKELGQSFEADWGSGAAMFFRTALFPDIVSFDERFFLYFEDVDFCTQLWKRGWSVVFYPSVVCSHREAKQSHKDSRFLLRHFISFFQYVTKHRGLPNRNDLVGGARGDSMEA